MSWIEESVKEAVKKNAEKYRGLIIDELNKQEAHTMQVIYNGFTGELDSLVRTTVTVDGIYPARKKTLYDLSIYDSEKQVTHSFTGVKLEDVKFLGGAVSFVG